MGITCHVASILGTHGFRSPTYFPSPEDATAGNDAMLALCRMLGIPSRYVSGYLETAPGRNLGSDASHAWVEAYLPGSGWVGFDPTNGAVVGQTYVKVGHGRDYDDVPPVKGLRRGGGTESLRVAVSVLREAEPGASTSASTA